MSSYIVYAILAYLLLALHGVADKFMLTNTVKHPVAYTFYAGTSSIFVFVLAPFGLHFLPWGTFLLALLSGACFLYAIYYLYKAIQTSTISRILPIQGGLVPLFTYLFAYLFLGDRLTNLQSLAFILLVVGAILLSIREKEGTWRISALWDATIAAILFAASFVLIKHVYEVGGLVSGLVWSRVGLILAALLFLVIPKYRKIILDAPKNNSSIQNLSLFYGTRFMGAIAGLFQHYAISMGSVVIVNALQGFQFVFVLIMTSYLSLYYPKILKENLAGGILFVKLTAIVLITGGIILLSL